MSVTIPDSTPQSPRFSVVIPTLNEGGMLHMTVDSVLSCAPKEGVEVVVVDDGSTDGSCVRYPGEDRRISVVHGRQLGVAGARNLGARHARGRYLIFLDAHCRVEEGWLERIGVALDLPQAGVVGPCIMPLDRAEPRGCGMTWINQMLETAWLIPEVEVQYYAVPFAPGGCQAFQRRTFQALGGYDSGFLRWGFEDIELSMRVWFIGLAVIGVPAVRVAHWFRETRDFTVADEDVIHNFVRLIHLHFSPPRIRRILSAAAEAYSLEETLELVYRSDVFVRRHYWNQRRVRNDDWLVSQFDLPV